MIIGDLDLGGRPAHLNPRAAMVLGNARVLGGRTITWAEAGDLYKLDVAFWISAWQARGGALAGTLQANRYLRSLLRELVLNPDQQPIYIQWAASADPTFPSRADPDDGWYFIESLSWDPETYNQAGAVEATATVTHVAPTAPSSLALWWTGSALTTTYTQAGQALIAYPIGSSGIAPTVLSRTGGEGVIPYSLLPASNPPNPVPFIRPTTVAGLHTGGCRVFDTVGLGANPVPTTGTYLHPNWLEVRGAQHGFTGDVVVTNGLLLLLYQVTGNGAPTVYLWNTNLPTPGWQQQGQIQYFDNANNAGTLREVNLEKVAAEETRIRVRLSTSAGNWTEIREKVARGAYHVYAEFWPLTQTNSNAQGLKWNLTGGVPIKIMFNDVAVADVVAQSSPGTAVSTLGGWSAAFGTTANGPILGLLYQNPPSANQSGPADSANIWLGDTSGPSLGSYRLYGFYAVPFPTAPNLQAEAEGGTLGTGWSSLADAAASGGNTARCLSGTLVGNADLFGVSWVPPAGVFCDIWFRARVTSITSTVGEMTLGLWNATTSAFVAGSSTTVAPSAVSTSYVWLRVNTSGMIQPTAGNNMQFRAVTGATLVTDWFIDEAVLVPRRSPNYGEGNFPADIWTQFRFDRIAAWARG